MSSEHFRWGILGPGSIARTFAEDLKHVPGAKITAVGSRDLARAEAFGRKFDVESCYGSYADLAADPNVDAIYVATPHPVHKENTLLCLESGKAVLCEKPFTINAMEAYEVAACARRNRVFCMEAMWTRFFPLMARIKDLVDGGAIGEVRSLHADMGFRFDYNPEGRMFKLELGGGALLDLGVYPISLASFFFGPPVSVTGLADIGETGVDENCGMVLRYKKGELGILSASSRTNTAYEVTIHGTEGNLRIHFPWWMPTAITLIRPDKEDERIEAPIEGGGYQFEAMEVMARVRAGDLESPVMPLNETIEIIETMDALRRQWGGGVSLGVTRQEFFHRCHNPDW